MPTCRPKKGVRLFSPTCSFLAFAALIILAWAVRPRWAVVALLTVMLVVSLVVGGKALSNLSTPAWLEAANAFATFTSADGREVQVYLEYTGTGWRVVPRAGTYFPPPAAVAR